jgi:hypothetical protein
MATIQCIVNFEGDQVKTTYQIVFDKTDKLALVTHTPGLTLTGNGSGAAAVKAALNNHGRATENAPHAGGQVVIENLPVKTVALGGFGTLTIPADKLSHFNLVHFECSGPGWEATANKGTQFPEPPYGG